MRLTPTPEEYERWREEAAAHGREPLAWLPLPGGRWLVLWTDTWAGDLLVPLVLALLVALGVS